MTAGLSASDPAMGRFLVAEEQVLDPNFARTVVLLISHDADGTLGLIVNRATDLDASEVMPDVDGLAGRDRSIYIGGPVEPRRIHILASEDDDEGAGRSVMPGLRSVSERPELESLLSDPDARFRVYAGYAGWAPGQLEAEIARGDWRVFPAGRAAVFDPAPATLWKRLRERASVRFAYAP